MCNEKNERTATEQELCNLESSNVESPESGCGKNNNDYKALVPVSPSTNDTNETNVALNDQNDAKLEIPGIMTTSTSLPDLLCKEKWAPDDSKSCHESAHGISHQYTKGRGTSNPTKPAQHLKPSNSKANLSRVSTAEHLNYVLDRNLKIETEAGTAGRGVSDDTLNFSEKELVVSPNRKNIIQANNEEFQNLKNSSREDQDSANSNLADDKAAKNANAKTLITPMDWLKHLPMYSNAIIYMSARLAQNCLQIYLTMYISDTIKLTPAYLGILPFIQYLFGFLASIATKFIQKAKSTSVAYLSGCLLVFAACLSVHILGKAVEGDLTTGDVISVMFIFALFGFGGNMVVCSALGLTAELIGDNTDSSAFVYGLMSLGDKVFKRRGFFWSGPGPIQKI